MLLTCCLVNNFGVLVAYVSGTFLDYDKVPYVVIVVPAVFLVGMAFLPETPSVLLRQNKIEVSLSHKNNLKDRQKFEICDSNF